MDSEEDNPLRLGPTYYFSIVSIEHEYRIGFMHLNFNLTELAKKRTVMPSDRNTCEILTLPRSELDSLNSSTSVLMDVDNLLVFPDQETAWGVAELLEDNKVYIIDRNYFYTENGVEMMKLIEIGDVYTNRTYDVVIGSAVERN
jgi:hypothetical protein